MTDTALNNPLVTAVMAVKSGDDVVALSSSNPLPVTKVSDTTSVSTTGNGTITTGGVSQVLLTDAKRKGYW